MVQIKSATIRGQSAEKTIRLNKIVSCCQSSKAKQGASSTENEFKQIFQKRLKDMKLRTLKLVEPEAVKGQQKEPDVVKGKKLLEFEAYNLAKNRFGKEWKKMIDKTFRKGSEDYIDQSKFVNGKLF